LATADCDTEKKFICDVGKKGTAGLALQQECLEIWGISAGKAFFSICVNYNLNINLR